MRRPALFVCVAATVLIAGCSGPVVTVRHALPAAVPLPAGVETVRVRKFAVHAADTGEVAALLTESLQKRLSRHWAIDGDARARARAVDVGGTITLETKDVTGTRTVRQWEGETRTWRAVQAPTLVLWGKQDPHISYEMAPLSVDLCEDGRLVTFEDAAHWVLHDKPVEVSQLMIEHFRQEGAHQLPRGEPHTARRRET